jgi:photosystem II PsbU protein
MKRLVKWLSVLSLVILCGGWLASQEALAGGLASSLTSGLAGHLQAPRILASQVEVEGFRNKVSDKMATQYGKTIDLNNTNLRAFRELQGMYPTLAALIVKNAPYQAVDDILDLPGLTEKQQATLRTNLGKFSVSEPEEALTEGADRINNGIYR